MTAGLTALGITVAACLIVVFGGKKETRPTWKDYFNHKKKKDGSK